MKKNNIFDFATGELSQDAMICWCLNWFNDSSNTRLNDMSKQIIKRISKVEDIRSIDILRQFSRTVYKNGVCIKEPKIQVKIDILLIVNETVPIIIEDKVYTSEHDDQINRYVEGITELVNQNNGKLIINQRNSYSIDINRMRTIFWKTGFLYDDDKVVIADECLNANDIMEIIYPYIDESEILDSYYRKLKDDLEWYEIHKKYWDYSEEYDDCHWDLNIARHEIAQYHLMREFFPENLWKKEKGKHYEKYQVYSGSSSGRPWTEMIVHYGSYKNCNYCVFWRIDTDSKAPYISLRLYEDNYGEKTKEIHGELWELMRNAAEKIVMKYDLGIEWDDVDPGYRKNCNEAAVFHYRFNEDIRNDWDNKKDAILLTIRRANDLFLEWVKTI